MDEPIANSSIANLPSNVEAKKKALSVLIEGYRLEDDESFRNEIAPEYKANRDETPEDLEPQFDLCVQVSRALGIAAFEAISMFAWRRPARFASRAISRYRPNPPDELSITR